MQKRNITPLRKRNINMHMKLKLYLWMPKLFVINDNIAEANTIQFAKKYLKIKIADETLPNYELDETDNILYITKTIRQCQKMH
jgi:hypothetical protein